MTPDRPNMDGNKESPKSYVAVYGHEEHTFTIPLSDLAQDILPNAPECTKFVDGKRCRQIGRFIKIIPESSQP